MIGSRVNIEKYYTSEAGPPRFRLLSLISAMYFLRETFSIHWAVFANVVHFSDIEDESETDEESVMDSRSERE